MLSVVKGATVTNADEKMLAASVVRGIRGLRVKYLVAVVLLIMILNYLGVFVHPFEKDYHTEFTYPLEGDVQTYVDQLEAGLTPAVLPINEYEFPFLMKSKKRCETPDGKPIRLLLIIKSAVRHFYRRNGIRQTFGWEKRFSDVEIRTVFVLGVLPGELVVQQQVMDEHDKYGDIVQADFVDSYFNNTIKTMMGFRWAMENCRSTQFVMFVDDDMYVSVKNVLRFVRLPQDYPKYMQRKVLQLNDAGHGTDIDEAPSLLFAGYVFFSAPHRHKISKWFITLDEYPFHMFPPYVTAGAFVLSSKALQKFYYTSKYTKHFRFDDVYLGIVAAKAGVTPLHNDNFYFWKKPYSPHNYRYVIASHGYDDTDELVNTWTEQRSLGYA